MVHLNHVFIKNSNVCELSSILSINKKMEQHIKIKTYGEIVLR